MAIINISRQPYSSGDEIAQEVAEKLNYKLINKHIINDKIKEFHCDFSDELHDLADEKKPGLFKTFFKNPQVYNSLLQTILFEEASFDNVVIKGRGGQYFMDYPYILNVRIVAPFEERCSEMEKQEGLKDHHIAEKLLESKDHEREAFINYIYKKDIFQADVYDLIFNHHKLDTDVIVSTILEYAKKLHIANPVGGFEKDLLKRLSLEKRVEASIRKEIPEHVHLKIECKKLGNIKISGFVSDEIERNNIFKLAQKCHGVDFVDNDLDTIRLYKT